MAGSRSSIDVFLSLHGQRKFAKEVAASGAELEAMGLKGAKSMARFAKSADKLKKFGKSWTHNVSLPVAGLGVVAGYMAVNFKRQMGLVATDAGGTMKEVQQLEGSVLDLARSTQYSPQELAESLFHVESAGYRGARAMKVLRESTKLATSGNSELEGTTYALVSAQKALNEGESLSGITKTAAQLNEIVAHGDIRLEELTAAMSTGLLPTAKALGLGVQDVGSALDIMTARGIPAQRAAYALNFTLQKLIPSTTKAEEAFSELGLGSEQLLNVAQKKGLPWALGVLEEKLADLPKGQQVQKIDEMFGGGRMSKGLLVVIQHLGEAKEKFHDINGDLQLYKKHVHEAEQQPLVKLKKAWSGIQASLVKIGGDLLPAAVPALEALATVSEKVAHAFLALPGPVKAATLAFLVLTGPVASGLGYFAGGVGRALILTKKLAVAGKDLSAFQWALGQGMGMSGASKYALRGSGVSAAAETAKGFAYSLGPAVAAYGIGNIITSATSGDWGEAGLEAGGAFVGGLAGYVAGGPMVGMLGMGIGSLAGELLGGLFGSGKKVLSSQEKIALGAKHVKSALEGQREASRSLVASTGAIVKSHHRLKAASQEVRHAESALGTAREEFGPNSLQAIRDEVHLAKAGERRLGVIHKLHRQERLHGENRSNFKLVNANAVLQERAQIRLLKAGRHEALLRKQALEQKGVRGKPLVAATETLLHRTQALREERANLYDSWSEGEKRIGPQWGHFVRHASEKALELGLNFKGVREETEGLYRALQKISKSSAPNLGPFRRGAIEEGLESAIGHHHREEHELGGTPFHPHRGAPGSRQPRHGVARRLDRHASRRLSLEGAGLKGVIHVHIQNENVLNMDGQKVAENTTAHSKRAALLE